MTGRRAIAGLCMLCALAFSAFAAQSAAAATAGTTAFTCANLGAGHNFKKAHCKPGDFEVGKGEFEHVAIAQGETTEIKGTNENTGSATNEKVPSKLKSVQAGVTLEIQSKTLHGEGSMTNNVAGKEHYAHGTGVINYTEVEVTAPAGKGCEVEGGKVVTNELTATTQGQGHFLKFTPKEGEVFASFTVKGCSIAALNHKYEAKGSVKGVPDGATTNFTHTATTEQGTLSLSGQKAGIEGVLTISGRAVGGSTYTPLSVTTVETE